MASAFAVNSRLIEASPASFPSWVSNSVRNDCNREVSAGLPSRIFSDLINEHSYGTARRIAHNCYPCAD